MVNGLTCEGCGKSYGRTRALDDVSLSVAPGEVVGLVGPNGAGKTTLLHAVVGLTRLDHGAVMIDGEPASQRSAKQKLAFMPDDLPRPRHLTAREVVHLQGALYGIPVDQQEVETLAASLDLEGRLDEVLAGFSHGMARKVDLLCALVVHPRVLVLDEPFSGMDPVVVERMCDLVDEGRRQGRATLLSTHDLELAERVADRVVVMSQGRVAFDGQAHELVASYGRQGIRTAFKQIAGGRR